MLLTILQIVGSLGVFLYGMKVMGEGLQKSAGNKLQSVLNFMTQNRLMGILTGFFITSIIQSSSATTVMVVSFVNAGLLSLTQAISTIMGANIGTTITTWIVSFFGFKVKITELAVPIIGLGLPLIFSKRKKYRDFGEFIVGFGILFIGLGFLRESIPDITKYPQTQEFLGSLSRYGVWSFLIYVVAGTLCTVIVQSSSAMMTITVTMAFSGWLDFPSAAALCLGENIGTTITANLASLGTNVNARRSARAHTIFNLFGVVWMGLVFHQFIYLVSAIAPWDFYVRENLPLNLALFHTLFNLSNSIILVPFVGYFSLLVEKLVKPGERDKITEYKLQYISTPLQDTADINLIEAKKEVERMVLVVENMFDTTLELYNNPGKKIADKVEAIGKTEELTDQMQIEITKFLQQCLQEDLSEENFNHIYVLMRIVHELESISDSIYNLCLAV